MKSTSPGCSTQSRYGALANSGKRRRSGCSTSTCGETEAEGKSCPFPPGVSLDFGSHLTGVVEELGLVRVQLIGVLWGVQTDVFASHHLMYARGRIPCGKQTATGAPLGT